MTKIKVLLVEDQNSKATRIVKALLDTGIIERQNIDVVTDTEAAKQSFAKEKYDLLIVDIQIPLRFGSTPLKDGGIRLLLEVAADSERYSLPGHIIAITAYDKAVLDYQQQLADLAIQLVKYDASTDNWVDKLQRKALHALASQRSPQYSRSYDYDVGIITALEDVEFDMLLHVFSDIKWNILDRNDSAIYHSAELPRNTGGPPVRLVATSAPQMGMVASSILATKLISFYRPRYLVMTGIAAGISDRIKVGDVLVAEFSWDYGSGKSMVKDGRSVFLPDPRPLVLDPKLRSFFTLIKRDEASLAQFRSAWPAKKTAEACTLHLGPLASGAAVVMDKGVVETVQSHNRKLIGIDMEGYGIMSAGHQASEPRPLSIVIKGISDLADENKDDDYQPYAAYMSAKVLRKLIQEHLFRD